MSVLFCKIKAYYYIYYLNLTILTFPIASNPLSKKNIIPRNKKAIPKPASPTPISERRKIIDV
jgi:hypothetical protein